MEKLISYLTSSVQTKEKELNKEIFNKLFYKYSKPNDDIK